MGIELPAPQGEAPYTPQGAPERAPVRFGIERTPRPVSAEVSTTERVSPQEAQTSQRGGDPGFVAQQAVAPATTNVTASAAAAPSPVSLDDVPVVAADDDLIEKQWVDSAKRIIKETRTDPYRQGEAISRLQADYLQKRYGKTLADSGV